MGSIERVITWNVGGRSDPTVLAGLLDLVEEFNPLALVLQEVADRTDMLKAFCVRTGYHLTQMDRGEHSGAVAVLTRGGARREGRGGFRMTPRTFVGRKVAGSRDDGWTKPKWTVWQKVQFWRVNWIIASTHLTPSHHVRRARILARAQVAALALWMGLRRRVVLLGGDFNEELDSRWNLLRPLKVLATPYAARSFGNREIDMWWVGKRRLARRGIKAKVEALDGYPSDHRPVMLTLTKPA